MESPSIKSKEPNPRLAAVALKRFALSREMPPRLTVGALCLDCRAFDLKIGDRAVQLTPAEFDLLYYLMSRAGQVFSAEHLLCAIWQYPPGAGRRELIRAHVKNLRVKIEQNPTEPTYLRTIGRLGYTISDKA